jgi:hypothetical protein
MFATQRFVNLKFENSRLKSAILLIPSNLVLAASATMKEDMCTSHFSPWLPDFNSLLQNMDLESCPFLCVSYFGFATSCIFVEIRCCSDGH